MTATANASYIEHPEFPIGRGSSFFWTMIALAALDVILLFWILNPLSKPSSNLPVARLTVAEARVSHGYDGAKHSPFGPVTTSRPQLRASR